MSKSISCQPWLASLLLALSLSGCGPSDSELALRAERDALRSQLEVAKQSLKAARQEANASREQIEQLDVRIANLNGDNLLLTRRLADAQARLTDAKVCLSTSRTAEPTSNPSQQSQKPTGGTTGHSSTVPGSDPPAETALTGSHGPGPKAPTTQDVPAGGSTSGNDGVRAETGSRQQTPDADTFKRILTLTQERNTLRERVGEIGAYARKKDDEIAGLNKRLLSLQQQLAQSNARIQTLTFAHQGNKALLRTLYRRLDLTGQERDLAIEAARAFAQRVSEQAEEVRPRMAKTREMPEGSSPQGPPASEEDAPVQSTQTGRSTIACCAQETTSTNAAGVEHPASAQGQAGD